MEVRKINGYSQIIKESNGHIIDCLCTCTWGTIHPNNWKEGKPICKHLKDILKNGKEKKY